MVIVNVAVAPDLSLLVVSWSINLTYRTLLVDQCQIINESIFQIRLFNVAVFSFYPST